MADEFWQPEYWQVELELVYDEGADLRDEYEADTGFYFFDSADDVRTGWPTSRRHVTPLRTAMALTPVSSSLTFECVR